MICNTHTLGYRASPTPFLAGVNLTIFYPTVVYEKRCWCFVSQHNTDGKIENDAQSSSTGILIITVSHVKEFPHI